jgi:CHAT domain-containing protein
MSGRKCRRSEAGLGRLLILSACQTSAQPPLNCSSQAQLMLARAIFAMSYKRRTRG